LRRTRPLGEHNLAAAESPQPGRHNDRFEILGGH